MSSPDHIWRKSATADWLGAHESALSQLTSAALAVIERPGFKRALIEVPCNGTQAAKLRRLFGGRTEKLPRDWLDQALRSHPPRLLRIGKRLLVSNFESDDPATLFIPAGSAFGTGDHATTAMSLRMLERVTRPLTSGWRMLDAGTGSGILALAAARFGAGNVLAIDNDPSAISTAKANARANRIRRVKFAVADVSAIGGGPFEAITANLYSEVLISVLPRFRESLTPTGDLILSGILRRQERELQRALRRSRFEVCETRRRGKWIALRARLTSAPDAKQRLQQRSSRGRPHRMSSRGWRSAPKDLTIVSDARLKQGALSAVARSFAVFAGSG